MLPLPFDKFIPQVLRDQLPDDPGGQAMVTKTNETLTNLRADTLQIEWLRNPEQCPSKYLTLVAEKYAVATLPADSDRVKRTKIKNAIKTHRDHGLFVPVSKPLIDAITGLDSYIYHASDAVSEDEVLLGDGIDEATSWSIFGGDGSPLYGFVVSGGDSDEKTAGVVWISLTNNPTAGAAITVDQLATIKEVILPEVPAYFIIYLGYEDASGYFVMYADPIVE